MLPDALFWKVHMYGIMVALGVLAAFGVLYLYNKKMKIDLSFTDFLFYDGIVSVLLGFGCAALFQGVYNYIENPAAGFSLKGGITFLGGMLGGAAVFIGVYLLLRRRLKGRLVSTLPGTLGASLLRSDRAQPGACRLFLRRLLLRQADRQLAGRQIPAAARAGIPDSAL